MSSYSVLLGLAAAIIVFGHSASAQTVDDLGSTKRIARQSIGLLFPEGSLKNCQIEDLGQGKEFECDLDPNVPAGSRRLLGLEIYSGKSAQKRTVIEGKIEISSPIRVRFASFGEHKAPFLRLEAGIFSGRNLELTRLELPGPFGASVKRAPGQITIRSHTALVDYADGMTAGTFLFEGREFSLDQVQAVLPGTEKSAPFSLSASGLASLRYDLANARASFLDSLLETQSPIRFSGKQTLAANGIRIGIGNRIAPAKTSVRFEKERASVLLSEIGLQPDEVSYAGEISLTSTKPKLTRVASIEFQSAQKYSSMEPDPNSTKWRGIKVQGLTSFARPNETAIVSGTAQLTFEKLDYAALSGELSLGSITTFPILGLGIASVPSAINVKFEKASSKPLTLKGTAQLSALNFGNLSLAGLSSPFSFSLGADSTIDFVRGTTPASVTVTKAWNKPGEVAPRLLSGQGVIDRFAGKILNFGNSSRQILIPQDGISLRVDKPSFGLTVAGGSVAVPDNRLVLLSSPMLISSSGMEGQLAATSPLSLSGVKFIGAPGGGGVAIKIGNTTFSATGGKIVVDPDIAAASPFGLTATFVAEGLSVKLDTPTWIQANDLKIKGTEIALARMAISANLVKARVEIAGLKLMGEEFKSERNSERDFPQFSGRLVEPIRVASAVVDIPVSDPVQLFNLNITDALVALKDVSYVDATGGSLRSQTLSLAIPELTDARVVAGFEVNRGTYLAAMSSAEFVGDVATDIRRAKLKVDGPRRPLRGRLELELGELKASGKAQWKVLEVIKGFGDPVAANPNFAVPLNVDIAIPALAGAFDFDGDLVSGGLASTTTASVRGSFVGHEKASWYKSWVLQTETKWRVEYPCVGSLFDPVRTCEAWGILLPHIEPNMKWSFVINAFYMSGGVVDYQIKPKRADREFACKQDPVLCPNGTTTRTVVVGVRQCHGHLTTAQPLLPISAFSLYPELIDNSGDIARLFNDSLASILRLAESTLVAGLGVLANIFGPNFYVFGGGGDCDIP